GLSVDIVDCIAEGIDWSKFETILRDCRPRYCVSNIISATYRNDLKALRKAKNISQAITIGMGPHLTNAPAQSLREAKGLDFIICNEAEDTIKELLSLYEKETLPSIEVLKDVEGIAFVPDTIEPGSSSEPVVTEPRPFIQDLDSLPRPRHDLLPLKSYWAPYLGHYTFVESSRGCAYHCIFCRQAVMWQWKFRSRSGKSIAEEAIYVNSLGVDNVLFHADTFTLDAKMVSEMCDTLLAAGTPFRWACNAHVKTLVKRPELLKKMKSAGCWMIAVGIESGDDQVLENIKKQITAADAEKVVNMIDDAGIEAWGYFVLGFPGDTVETMNKTIDFALRLPLKMAKFDIAAPYPGTEFYQYAKEHDFLRISNYEEFDQNASAVVEYPNLSRAQIKAAVRRGHRRFYLRPRSLLYMLREVKDLTALKTVIQIALDQFRLLSGSRQSYGISTDESIDESDFNDPEHNTYLQQQVDMHKHLSHVYTDKRYAPAYSQIYQRHWNRVLCDLADLPVGARVLDFGCGTGILFETLKEQGYQAVGLDLSIDMLTSTKGQTDVDRICADGCNTPFADDMLDAVLCRGSIHHLPDLESAFQEIKRILKPGGVLAFSEPSNDSIVNRLARRVMYRKSDEFHEEDEGFRRDEIVSMLEGCGFEIQVSRGFGFFAYTLAGFPDKLGMLDKIPGNCRLTRMLIRLDGLLESLPKVNETALHWQLRAIKK
ncbi:MAG: methyltransferase domain-containing protein, partial [Deltaproteobacteria bacterium]|nr:methyltransferase domain-containing protein [Deltaproteobacteria bacterium]